MNPTRKSVIAAHNDKMAPKRDKWVKRNSYFYKDDRNFMQFLVTPGQRILEIGSGNGDLLRALQPSYGVGVDISKKMIELARVKHPSLTFIHGDVEKIETLHTLSGPFDVIVFSDAIGLSLIHI